MKTLCIITAAALVCAASITNLAEAAPPARVPGRALAPPAANGVSLAVNATNAQMIAEMQIAVGDISKKYGSPPFAFLFSSDPKAAEKVGATLEEINAMKLTRQKLFAEINRLREEQVLAKRKTEEAQRDAQRKLVNLEAVAKALVGATSTLRENYIEVQRLDGVKKRLEADVADMAIRIEQIRLIGGFGPTTISPAAPAGYTRPNGVQEGAAAGRTREVGGK
jgi:hypothetical protein